MFSCGRDPGLFKRVTNFSDKVRRKNLKILPWPEFPANVVKTDSKFLPHELWFEELQTPNNYLLFVK